MAQLSEGGIPPSFKLKFSSQLNGDIDTKTMPPIDMEQLQLEDSINDSHKTSPWRFGKNFPVNFSKENSGTWETLPNGDRLWRLAINCPGALTINLTFNKYQLPEGAKLFVYNGQKSHVIGAFTTRNNQEHGRFATTLVRGDVIFLEYLEPKAVTGEGELSLEKVTHGYRSPSLYANQIRGLNDAGTCNNNVICPVSAGWEDQIRSVVMLVSGGNGFCTGAVVNNTIQDATPYVLTADHCYSDPSTWVFWFNWESTTCPNPSTSPTYDDMTGATLRARNGGSDFCLVEINNPIPSGFNPYFAGWDNSGNTPTSQVAIHHPSGDIKKISFDDDPASAVSWNGAACWEVTNWEDGTTEPGSSGSPLFDQNKRIIGQLYGGTASCTSISDDNYGRLDVSWNGATASERLKDWLDPSTTGVATLDGYDPNQPTVALDASIFSVQDPMDGSEFCEQSIAPRIGLINKGLDTLYNVEVTYRLDGGTANTISWTGVLATNQSEAIQFPSVTVATGAHNIIAYTANPNGSSDMNTSNDTASSDFMIINPSTVPVPLTEGFDSTGFPPGDWTLGNPDNGEAWKRTTDASGFGNSTASAKYDNYTDDNSGQLDYLFSPYLDLSGGSFNAVKLTFNVAYARYSNNYFDSLIIMATANCGKDWLRVYANGNSGLATTADQTNAFIPDSSEWRTDTVDLGALVGNSTVQIAFVNKSGWGNNIYIDDINITASNEAPIADFALSNLQLCSKDSVEIQDLSINVPTSWEWEIPGGSPSNSTDQHPIVGFDTSGNYSITLIATNAFGSDTLTLTNYIEVNPSPEITVDSLNTESTGGSSDAEIYITATDGTAPYFYSWSNNSTAEDLTGIAAGTYTITVTDSTGCKAEKTVHVVVTGSNETVDHRGVSVYPNPTKGSINLIFETRQEKSVNVTVFNILGAAVYHEDFRSNSGNSITIDLNKLSDGAYYVRIATNNAIYRKKIIINKY